MGCVILVDMKLGKLVLLGSALFFICGCNNKGGGDDPSPSEVVISELEARDFINNKYQDHEVIIPSKDSSVTWNIEKDHNNFGARHIGMYLTDPTKAEEVSSKGTNVNINQERANVFKSELIDSLINVGDVGYEAVVSLNPTTYKKLKEGQGREYFYLTFKKINNKSLTIISELKEENSNDVYKRIHTYNENGYESKFELEFRDASMDYSFSVDFIYQ